MVDRVYRRGHWWNVVDGPSDGGWWVIDEESRLADGEPFETEREAREALAALRDGDWR